jgi:zinc protease
VRRASCAAALLLVACATEAHFGPATRVARPPFSASPAASTAPELATEPPPLTEAPEVELPKIGDVRLACGARLITLERHKGLAVATIRVAFDRGAADAPSGMVSLLAASVLVGTTHRTGAAIVQQVNILGTKLTWHVTLDSLSFTIDTARATFDSALDILVDAVLHPTFPEAAVAEQRDSILRTHDWVRIAPEALAEDGLLASLFPEGHPYHEPSWGTVATVGGLRAADVAALHRKLVAPERATVIVAGDFDGERLVAKLSRALDGWHGAGLAAVAVPAVPPPQSRKIVIYDHPGDPLVQLAAGFVVPERGSPDRPALSMDAYLLDGRLERAVRLERGASYGIDASVTYYRGAGLFLVKGAIDPAQVGDTITAVLKEVDGLRAVELDPHDVTLAKATATARLALDLETSRQIVATVTPAALYGDTPEKVLTRRRDGWQVPIADARRVAAAYLPADKMRIVLVGDGAKIKEATAGLGDVEVLRPR